MLGLRTTEKECVRMVSRAHDNLQRDTPFSLSVIGTPDPAICALGSLARLESGIGYAPSSEHLCASVKADSGMPRYQQ